MPIHYDTIEDGQNKKSHLLFSKFWTITECNTTMSEDTLPLQPESGCPYACIWAGHPENPYVLNHMITEGECIQSWFVCFHKYFWSKPYTNIWRKILEMRITRITEIRNGMRKLTMFFVKFWLLNSEGRLHIGLNNMVSHQHF